MGSHGSVGEGAVKALLIAALGLALLAGMVFVGLYSYTDTTLFP